MSKAKVKKKLELYAETVTIKKSVYEALYNCYRRYEQIEAEFLAPDIKKYLAILEDEDLMASTDQYKKPSSVKPSKEAILNDFKIRFKNLNGDNNTFSVLNFNEIHRRVEDLVSKDDDLDLNENIYEWPIAKTNDRLNDLIEDMEGAFNAEFPSNFTMTLLQHDRGLTCKEFITFLKSLGDK